jgi:hypothetical protein
MTCDDRLMATLPRLGREIMVEGRPLQLSYEDQAAYGLESLNRDQRSLEDPLVNLRCGTRIMARLVARDAVVARGTGKHSRGTARYWSVLRQGHHVEEIRTRTKLQLGL